ncbi:HupE/UreJ family protein [Terricaulis sp.]|uniref:HupE/UreJ family protein n=1 Tax=Terricaulis sp. TaxID=2768686 RepID=UPI003783ADD9
MIRVLAAALLAILVFAGSAQAHTRSQSQSRWTVDGDALSVRIQTTAVDVTRLYALGGEGELPLTDALVRDVEHSFQVTAAGQACAPQGHPNASLMEAGTVTATWRFACPAGALARGPIEIESQLFLRVAPSHLHFVSLRDGQGRIAEAVLTEPHPSAVLNPAGGPQAQSILDTILRFLPVGAQHVWTGLDHVAFILALVLLTAGDLRRVILAATGFTLGHTATLGLAATGVLKPDTAAIEALIGFTIAFVALEAGGGDRMKTWSAPAGVLLAVGGVLALTGTAPMSPLVWFGLAAFVFAYPRGFPRGAVWLAMIFGLIHGCGFAGALSELDLPKPRLLASLAGFNLGVEFGQIAVIALALLVGLAMQRAPERVRREAPALAGAILFALGFYWFVGRLA